jgi:uncharacterized protein YjgD (DUF1641 family)
LFVYVEHMITNVANEEVCGVVSNACDALSDAADETANSKNQGGIFATMKLLSKPETQRSLQFMLRFADKLQNGAGSRG